MQIDFYLILPEIALAVLGLMLLVFGLIVPKSSRQGFGWFTALYLMVVLGMEISGWKTPADTANGIFLCDNFAMFFKITCLTAAILVVLGSMRFVDQQIGKQSEYYSILTFATLGMCVMASAGDFITLYLGLELMSISFIILVCFRRSEAKSVESGVKYLLLASISSAILLYGISLIYGVCGSFLFTDILVKVTELGGLTGSPILVLGLAMLLAGFGFKVSLVPFHMWTPDVYEGAPTPITSFLAVGSKAASLAIVIRVFLEAFGGMTETWTLLIAILAAITMVVGNLVAIPQTNIKRMLAFSSIAQAGYMLVGLVAASEAGIKGMMFYAFLYVFATVGAFTVAAMVYNKIGSDEIKDYAGLAQRSPLMAATMLIMLLSMAGIPPLAGFAGKFYLFSSIIDNYLWLAFVGMIISMISVYYYLRVVLVMYRDNPPEGSENIKLPSAVALTLVIVIVATVFMGVYPGPIAEVVNTAAHSFFFF
ncbi:MAG: NADH-quinone oxidoreductase subunit N [Clostridia bacterium]|nr:NADH-quinone oxidoreductase subunit N [Clostridia bacterium]